MIQTSSLSINKEIKIMMLSELLPPIGMEIPCSMYALKVPLQVNVLGLVMLDFKGGIRVRVENNLSEGLGGIKQRVIGFEVSADSPVLGRVTISQADTEATPLSILQITKNEPPTFQNIFYLDLTVTIEKPPGGGPPLVLSSTKTAALINQNLPYFLPLGAVYQLQAPVDLVPVGAPDQVVAQLQQFPATVSHNP